MNATDWSYVEPDEPDTEGIRALLSCWLLAFWAVLAALVFVVVLRRMRP